MILWLENNVYSILNPWCDLWQLIQRASAYVITGKYQKYLVGHVFVENLPRIGTNKRSHRNVIQTPQTPAPEKEKKTRENTTMLHTEERRKSAISETKSKIALMPENCTMRLRGTFRRRHLLSDKNTSAQSERLRERPKQGLIFFCQLKTKASQENLWVKRRQLTS